MGYNTLGAPRLSSFAAAVKWHNDTKPIRGTTVRPLGVRRYHNAAYITMPDPDTVRLHYYNNTLVEWRSDNTFTLHAPKYYSAYVGEQIIGYVPRPIGFEWDKGRLFVVVQGKHVELPRQQSLKFLPTEGGAFQLEKMPEVRVYKAKRGMADAVTNRQFGAFLEWVSLTSSIAGNVPHAEVQESYKKFRGELGFVDELLDARARAVDHLPWDGLRGRVHTAIRDTHYIPYSPRRGGSGFHRESAELLAAWMTQTSMEHWVCALGVVLEHTGVYTSPRSVAVGLKDVREYVKTIATFLHRDEVFEVVNLPAGTMPSKRNSQYFNELYIDRELFDTVSECSSTKGN